MEVLLVTTITKTLRSDWFGTKESKNCLYDMHNWLVLSSHKATLCNCVIASNYEFHDGKRKAPFRYVG